MFLFHPVPNQEAVDFIAGKPAVAQGIFRKLLPHLKARAFTISHGLVPLEVIERARNLVAGLPAGGDWDEIKKEITNDLSPFFIDPAADDETREAQLASAARRAELLLRAHGHQAYAMTNYALAQEDKELFPYQQYMTIGDERVRASHAVLNGKILPVDHPFWNDHTPPWDWQCRCDVRPIDQDEYDQIAKQDRKKPLERRRIIEGEQLRLLEQRKQLVDAGGLPIDLRTGVEKGHPAPFIFRPGEWHFNEADLARFYPSDVWDVFRRWAQKTIIPESVPPVTVAEWMRGAVVVQMIPAAPKKKAPKKKAPRKKSSASSASASRKAIAKAAYTSETNLGGGVNQTTILANGVTVVFKPAAGEYGPQLRQGILPGEQYKREKAASLIDEALGLGLVPPTEIITYKGEVGSAQLFRQGFQTRAALGGGGGKWQGLAPDQLEDIQLLDDCLQHLDRHNGNWMLRRPKGAPHPEIALIDNGLSLSAVDWRRKVHPGPLDGQPIGPANLARLDTMLAGESSLRTRLEPLIGPDATRLFFTRSRALRAAGVYGDY